MTPTLDKSQNARLFLLNFHAAYPGSTSSMFSECRTASGQSSYDLLADGISFKDRILDLGCGDGFLLSRLVDLSHQSDHLVGIDISVDELQIARTRPQLAHVNESRVFDRPPFVQRFRYHRKSSIFHALSPLESALDEASRVLAPGGSFKGIMGGGPACIDETNAVDLYLECLEELPDAERCEIPQLSDIRLRQPGGLRSVLRQHPAFCSFKMTHHHVSQVVSFEEAWTRLSQLYESSVLTDNARSIVKRNFRSRCADKFSRRQIRLAWAVRHFSVERTEYIGT